MLSCMTAFPFELRFSRFDRVAADLSSIATEAEAMLYRQRVVRAYGDVQVEVDLAPLADAKRAVKLSPLVRGAIDRNAAASYVELFAHDLFLILNLAVPGAFSGAVNGMRFDARVFEYAWVTAARNDWPWVDTVPLEDVLRWYPLGTKQIATSGTETALFHLLHLARNAEDENEAVTRLAQSLEALGAEVPSHVEELRAEIARGTARLVHPMHDELFEDSLDAMALDFTDAADLAASLVVSALQASIRMA